MTQCWAGENTYHKSWPSVEHDGTVWPGTLHGLGIGQQVVSHQVVPQMLLQAIHHGTGHALLNKHRTLNNQSNKEERVGNSSICPVNYVGYNEWGKRVGVGVGRGVQTILKCNLENDKQEFTEQTQQCNHTYIYLFKSSSHHTNINKHTETHTHTNSHTTIMSQK